MKYFSKTFLCCAFMIATSLAYGQKPVREKSTADSSTKADTAAKLKAIAGSPAKSNLSYQALVQFFQANLTSGSNGGFTVKSSLFGLHYLFSHHNDSLSNYYIAEKETRNTQLAIGVNKAVANTDEVSRLTLGITWSPLNQRDKSLDNFSGFDDLLNDEKNINHAMLFAKIIYTTNYIIYPSLEKYLDSKILPSVLTAAKRINALKIDAIKNRKIGGNNWLPVDIEDLLKPFGVTATTIQKITQQIESQLPGVVEYVNSYKSPSKTAKPNTNFSAIGDSVFMSLYKIPYAAKYKALQKKYADIGKRIDMGQVLTFSITPGYNVPKSHIDTTTFMIKYIVGLGKNIEQPWSLDLQASAVSQPDSAAKPNNFGHDKVKLLGGFDKIFCRDSQDDPLIEAEFQGEYDNVLDGRYAHEEKITATANLVTTIHLSKEFSLPLTLKFEPKGGNLFGFLSVQWNLQDSNTSKTNSATNATSN